MNHDYLISGCHGFYFAVNVPKPTKSQQGTCRRMYASKPVRNAWMPSEEKSQDLAGVRSARERQREVSYEFTQKFYQCSRKVWN